MGSKKKSAFEAIKKQLTFNSVLVHYDPNAELILSYDASPYEVGAVLSHRGAAIGPADQATAGPIFIGLYIFIYCGYRFITNY